MVVDEDWIGVEAETASEGGCSVTLGKTPPQHESPASLSLASVSIVRTKL